MTSHKTLFTLSVLIALYAATAQYDTYEHNDEEDESSEEEKPRVDYSKYFGGLGAAANQGLVAAPGNPAPAADSSAGFVTPLDFTGIFTGGHFGLSGLASGASQQLFQTPGGTGVALPLPSGVFPVVNDPVTSNTSGFVNDVKFPSLFDSSSSSSDTGFRPQDFIHQGSRSEATSPSTFYSPAFSSLQRDVDKEVDYQRKEEDNIERSRAASRRDPEYDSEDDDDEEEFDSFEFDDGPETEYRSSPKHNQNPVPREREERQGDPNRKALSYKTPYSTVNQVNLQGPSRPVQVNGASRTPLPTLPEPEEDYAPSVNYRSRQYSGNSDVPPRNRPSKHNAPYPRTNAQPIQPYNAPPPVRQLAKPYLLTYKTRPIKNEPSYYSAQSRQLSTSPKTHSSKFNKQPIYFRPSPRDPYLDSPQQYPNERSLSERNPKIQDRGGIYPLPQTEYATVVEKIPNQPKNVASENKKECKKINKKIDPNDFARFKRQQMTCYICTNKAKGNTYEECSYESDPKPNSFYKGSAEAYSSDTILMPTKYHIRDRRSTTLHHSNGRRHKYTRPRVPARKVRQYDYEDEPDERGHGSENYRFGPEYFQGDEGRQNVKRKKPKQQKPMKRTDYDEYDEDEDGEETDVEKEYAPPGASENDDCRKVNRNGLICMVCQKPNGGGTYEQCSYASDPEANRYEYAKSSSYGTKKKPQNHRYKRYSVNDNGGRQKYQRYYANKRNHGQSKKNLNRRGDFRNGKLKRKKVVKADYKSPLYQTANDPNTPSEEEYTKIVGLDPFLYGSSETYNPDDYDDRGKKIKRRQGEDEVEAAASSTEDESEDAVPTYEDSFYRLFPELAGTDPYTGESVEKKVKEKKVKEKKATEKQDDFEHPIIPYEEAEDEEESESVQTNRKVKPGFEYAVDLPDYYFEDDTSKKDLEKTLDEFTHKNRSDCKKVMKDKMTCYQCINKNGLQHEECMFVAASEPKSKHLAYHEVKEFRVVPTEKSMNESTSNNPLHAHQNGNNGDSNNTNKLPNNRDLKYIEQNNDDTHSIIYKIPKKDGTRKKENQSKRMKPLIEHQRNIYTEKVEGQTLPPKTQDILKLRPIEVDPHFYDARVQSEVQREKRNPKKEPVSAESRKYRQSEAPRKETSKEEREEEEDNAKPPPVKPNYNAVPPDPENFDEREGPEGAYSHETEPVYDSILKITLPRYMLARSEHEDIFDEVLRSG